jgi:hypothetical protein
VKLRSQGSKFLLSSPNIEHVQTMTQDVLPTLESAGNLTPFSEANEDGGGKADLKNVGIKTTISITHNRLQQDITEKTAGDNSPSKTSLVNKNPSQASNMLMQPLGSTLRSKRANPSQAELLEKTPSRVTVTKTTFNYDSNTGVQQQITETLHHKSPSQKKPSQSDGTHSALVLGKSAALLQRQNTHDNTNMPHVVAQSLTPEGFHNEDLIRGGGLPPKREDNQTQLTSHLSNEKSREGIEPEQLGAKFSM